MPEYHTIVIRGGLEDTLLKSERRVLEQDVLPAYLAKRRWFTAKNEAIKSARLCYLARLPGDEREIYLSEVETQTASSTARWLLPLTIVWEGEPPAALPGQLALAHVRRERRVGLLTDGFSVPAFARAMVSALARATRLASPAGEIRFDPVDGMSTRLKIAPEDEINWISAEQSNSSLTVGDSVMLKIFRRTTCGQHPEAEMGRYLTERGFANAPALLGEIVRVEADGSRYALGIAQQFVRNQGDAWTWLTDRLLLALDDLKSTEPSEAAEADHLADCDQLAARIGLRLGEMHNVLAQPTDDPAFSPIAAGESELAHLRDRARTELEAAFKAIAAQNWGRPTDRERAVALMERRTDLLAAIDEIPGIAAGTTLTRIHGDFHLGQVLVASGDAFIIDFEGEPARSLEERRAKASPLRDVAGLLRSLDYVAATIRDRKKVGAASMSNERTDSFLERFRSTATKAFMKAYLTAAADRAMNKQLLNMLLVEKAAYEVNYEAASRPTWLPVPLAGLATLAQSIFDGRRGRS
jgi:maltose alpha-D-glucosyltransferase / alpha-amylase